MTNDIVNLYRTNSDATTISENSNEEDVNLKKHVRSFSSPPPSSLPQRLTRSLSQPLIQDISVPRSQTFQRSSSVAYPSATLSDQPSRSEHDDDIRIPEQVETEDISTQMPVSHHKPKQPSPRRDTDAYSSLNKISNQSSYQPSTEVNPSSFQQPGRRTLRQRNPKQQNPYSYESARYQRILTKNGWEDALVKNSIAANKGAYERKVEEDEFEIDGWLQMSPGEKEKVLARRRHRAEKREHQKRIVETYGGTLSSSDDDIAIPISSKKRNTSRKSNDYIKKRNLAFSSSSEGSDKASDNDEKMKSPNINRSDAKQSGDESDDDILDAQRKAFLFKSMPAVFAKRAIADLRLMQKEKQMAKRKPKSTHSSIPSPEVENNDDERKAIPGFSRTRMSNGANILDPLLLGDEESDSDVNDNSKVIDISSNDEDDKLSQLQDRNEDIGHWLVSDDDLDTIQGVGGDLIDTMLTRATKSHPSRKSYKKGKDSSQVPRKRRRVQKQQKIPFLPTVEKDNHPKTTKRNSLDIPPKGNINTIYKPRKTSKTSRSKQLGQIARNSSTRKHQSKPKVVVQLNNHDDSADNMLPNKNTYTDKAINGTEMPTNAPEGWNKLSKSSIDFGIKPLPSFARFSETRDIATGYFHQMLNSAASIRGQSIIPFYGFNISLTHDTSTGEVIRRSSTIFDEAFKNISNDLHLKDFKEAFQFLCLYAALILKSEPESFHDFRNTILDQVDQLNNRITSISDDSQPSDNMILEINFFAVEFLFRTMNQDESNDALETAYMRLVEQLLDIGLLTGRSLRELKDLNNVRILQDRTLELLVVSLHLAPIIFEGSTLWDVVEPTIKKLLGDSNYHAIVECEIIWYACIGISVISQLSITGLSASSTSIVNSNWSLVHAAINKLDFNCQTENTIMNRASTSRDHYIKTIYIRCFLLVSDWNWKFDDDASITIKLFDILNTRKLQDFLIEKIHDFPSFVREYNDDLNNVYEKQDTSFHLLLKLIRKSVIGIRENIQLNEKKQIKFVNRFISRVSPTRVVALSKSVQASIGELSILINHYSLVLILLHVQPSSAKPRLAQAKSFCTFSEVDWSSRKVIIRAMMYMVIIYRHHSLDITALMDWFAELIDVLLNELNVVEKIISSTDIEQYNMNKSLRNKKEIVVTLRMILRSFQHIIVTPSLDKGWTKNILESPLALTSDIGIEVIKCVETFLDMRRHAMPVSTRKTYEETAEDDNDDDEFEMFDLDINDPHLNKLLGEEVDVDPLQLKDEEFAQIIKAHISPAIHKLLSNIHIPNEDGTCPSDERPFYVEKLINCWAGCAHVLVQHDLTDWSTYMLYGSESYRRISNESARRNVGRVFLENIKILDPSAYPVGCPQLIFITTDDIIQRVLELYEK
ncbi:hypothetical protein E3Q17_01443 [Wallemia mellicola]|uniref:Uncharacterized protein n=1 Tax=Wallemia mellicola TaxID=1708541 RepID=A0A4T0NXY6_9BASI|nr:hypothetical protein E3Q17_01443 [Wallemia mellicola]